MIFLFVVFEVNSISNMFFLIYQLRISKLGSDLSRQILQCLWI